MNGRGEIMDDAFEKHKKSISLLVYITVFVGIVIGYILGKVM